MPFWAYLSADQLAHSPELLEVVCDAGLGTFMGGIQTGDENFCKKIYNRINHNENFLNEKRICKNCKPFFKVIDL